MASTNPNRFHSPHFFSKGKLSLNSIGFIRLPLWCVMLSKPDELGLLHGMRTERAENSRVCLKRVSSAPNQGPTTHPYLPESALVGLMASDRIIPKEWFVLCKVHIWGPAETREVHIISCTNINCVMERKRADPDWETASVQTVCWSRWLTSFFFLKRGILPEVFPCAQVRHACSLQSSHVVLMIFKWCHAKLSQTGFSSNKSVQVCECT